MDTRPLNERCRQVTQLRKSGALDEALQHARSLSEANPQDAYVASTHAWVLWALLKKDKEALTESEAIKGHHFRRLEELLREYSTLNVKRPDLVHSQVLSVTLHFKGWMGALGFMKWWFESGGFLADDHEGFMPPGQRRPLMSLVERFSVRVAKLLVTNKSATQDELTWAEAITEQALNQQPNQIHLNYYWTKLLLQRGALKQARTFALKVVKRNPRAMWTWDLLNSTLAEDEHEMGLHCWRYAIELERDPVISLKVQEKLVVALVEQGIYDEATWRLKQLLALRHREGYKVSERLQQLSMSTWYTTRKDQSLTTPPSSKQLVLEWAGLEERRQRRSAGTTKQSAQEETREVIAKLTQNEGQPFGFLREVKDLGDVWVPPRLMECAPEQESRAQVKALIKMGEHPKTKKISWRVVRWL